MKQAPPAWPAATQGNKIPVPANLPGREHTDARDAVGKVYPVVGKIGKEISR